MTETLKIGFIKITILCLALSISLATVVTDYSGAAGDINPICSAPHTFGLNPQNLKASPATTLDFDYAFTYMDTGY